MPYDGYDEVHKYAITLFACVLLSEVVQCGGVMHPWGYKPRVDTFQPTTKNGRPGVSL